MMLLQTQNADIPMPRFLYGAAWKENQTQRLTGTTMVLSVVIEEGSASDFSKFKLAPEDQRPKEDARRKT
jgi:hypothetical protein